MTIDVVKGYTNYGKPNGNGFMDISANGARVAFKASTDFSKMPQPGPHDRPIALFMEGHFGVLGNDGFAYESTPPCVRKHPVKGRGWIAWAPFPDKWLSFKDGVIRTHEEIVALCESVIGMPYWYGCFGQAPTKELMAAKRKQYPAQYGRIKSLGNYEGAIGKYAVVMDCIGLGRYVCLAKHVKISAKRPELSVAQKTAAGQAGDSAADWKLGDRVKVKPGATHYWPGGPAMPNMKWFRSDTFTVNSDEPIKKGGVLCVHLKEINTWCAMEHLSKV